MTDTTLAQRLRDQHHMTQGDGLGAMLATANEAANRIEELETDIRIGMANFDAAEAKLAKVEAAFVEQAKMLKTSTDAGLETLAANTRLSAELAEARKVISMAVPTINAVERLRDIRSAGYPRKSEEASLCKKIETFCDSARSFLARKEASHAE